MAKKFSMTEKEANAFKAQAEGKAALVTAWMPLMKIVAERVTQAALLFVALKIADLMGIDFPSLKPIIEIISKLK